MININYSKSINNFQLIAYFTMSATKQSINTITQSIYSLYEKFPGINIFDSKSYFNSSPISDNQTKAPNIFIVEEYYGSPAYLHTYCGKFRILGSVGGKIDEKENFNESLKKMLGLVKIKQGDYEGGSYINERGYKVPKRSDSFGYYGPYYLVTRINKEKISVSTKEKFSDYYKAKKDKMSIAECKDYYKSK